MIPIEIPQNCIERNQRISHGCLLLPLPSLHPIIWWFFTAQSYVPMFDVFLSVCSTVIFPWKLCLVNKQRHLSPRFSPWKLSLMLQKNTSLDNFTIKQRYLILLKPLSPWLSHDTPMNFPWNSASQNRGCRRQGHGATGGLHPAAGGWDRPTAGQRRRSRGCLCWEMDGELMGKIGGELPTDR